MIVWNIIGRSSTSSLQVSKLFGNLFIVFNNKMARNLHFLRHLLILVTKGCPTERQ
jgi:hypothetical protein